MRTKFKFDRESYIRHMKRFPSCWGHNKGGNPNMVPLTKGSITLNNNEGRVIQVMPFRSRQERKETFKRINNIKGVASFDLVFYST